MTYRWDSPLGFNPYFTGCFSFRRVSSRSSCGLSDGFNPYFTGCFSFRGVCTKGISVCRYVSILILLDASLLDPYQVIHCEQWLHVSILILLDASLLAGLIAAAALSTCCFNPYFTGCFSFRLLCFCIAFICLLFQSLFYWMLLF